MKAWFAALLPVAAGAGDAQARVVDDRTFCTTLRTLLTAAAERPAFASLGQEGPMRAAEGLGFERCTVEPDLYGNRIVCNRLSNPRYPTGPATEARIVECLPEALRMSEPAGSSLARFRLGTLAFHVERGGHLTWFRLFALPVER